MVSDNYEANTSEGTYLVHLGELSDWQMGEHEHNVKCDTFERAKAYALKGFQAVLERLTYMCEKTQGAETPDDLDLGWCRPIIERIDMGNELRLSTSAIQMTTRSSRISL